MQSGRHEHEIHGAGDLAPGQSLTFTLECGGHRIAAFVINFRDVLRAYVNRCRHIPVGLDWVENQFFTEEGAHLICATHGALYDPETGECVDGPPCGLALIRIPLRVQGNRVLASCPDTLAE